MNIVAAGALLLSAGALALTALPQPDIHPGLIVTGAAAANQPAKQEEGGEGGQWRQVRVVLASPYGPHTERAREVPKRAEKAVDTMVVSALPEPDEPAFANDPSNHPAKIISAAPRSQRSAKPTERAPYVKGKSSTLARIDAVSEQASAARGGQASYRIAAIDERP
jgi:hypothetical protein